MTVTTAKVAKKQVKKKTFRLLYVLGWEGMRKHKFTLYDIPSDKVQISDWFHAKLKGELCINAKGEIDQLKKITYAGGNDGGITKRTANYHFKHDKEVSTDAFMVFVKPGKIFKRWNQTFTAQKHGYKAVIEEGRDDNGEPIKKKKK